MLNIDTLRLYYEAPFINLMEDIVVEERMNSRLIMFYKNHLAFFEYDKRTNILLVLSSIYTRIGLLYVNNDDQIKEIIKQFFKKYYNLHNIRIKNNLDGRLC